MNMLISRCLEPAKPAICLLLILVATSALGNPDPYTLLGRTGPVAISPPLSNHQQRWLAERHELVLGTSAPDYPPFDISVSGRDYEGISADYASVISQALNVPVRTLRFESRSAAIDALKQGRIDLLGSANRFEAIDSGISLSLPYATDQPVLVSHSDDTRPLSAGLAGLRLSMVYHYLPPDEVQTQYPGAILQTYPSFRSAINAVAFGQADVFLGDTISTRYVINHGYLNNIRMARFGKHEASGFGFAVRHDNPDLLEILNRTLRAIPSETRNDIARRWNAADDLAPSDQSLQLSAAEHAWISRHPKLRVVVDPADAPLSFFDNTGNLRGVSADVLDLLRLRTGLQFDIRPASSAQDMAQQLAREEADLIAALLPDQALGGQLTYSRPYLDNAFVLVTRLGEDQPTLLQQLSGKRLAVAGSDTLQAWLAQHHRLIEQTPYDSAHQALTLLMRGQVEGVVMPLLSANYLLSAPEFENRLHITATAGEAPALISLASRSNNPELAAIINKALVSITPQEMASIHDRWRTWSSAANHHDYRPLLYRVLLGAGVTLLALLAWNAWMRRQISQRKAAERALSDQLQFMGAMLDGTPHPLYVRDREGRLRLCNDSYLQTFATQRDQVIGHTVTEGVLSDPDQARQYAEDYRQVMASGTPLITDRPLHIGQRRLTIYHWILPFHDSLGEMQGIIGGWIDISERRQLLEDLQAAKDSADNANRAKSTFLATMSHEIRTPMNAVIGMLELALKRADQGQLERPAIEVAYSSANDLLELIGDILDIARIEAGQLSLNPERARLRLLSGAVVRMFEGLAQQKNLALKLEFDSRLDVDVLIDPLRFKQVLSNLISNAIKFTATGQVRVTLQAGKQSSHEHLDLKLSVQDSGIGISASDQQRLFEPFAQVENNGQMPRSGAGLGLVICRTLCTMMGGKLHLQSRPGQGTCVTFELMLERLATDQPAAQETSVILPAVSPPTRALNILVVDDHPANRMVLTQQLEFLGHRCQSAEHGKVGLQLWQQTDFDLLMVDCNMPVMNGYELTAAIRDQELLEQRLPCIIWGFTANAQPEEIQRCRDAGMDDCLFKPIGLGVLGERLASLAAAPEHGARALLFDPGSLEKLTAGRNEMTRRLLRQLLDSNQQDRQALIGLDPHHQRPDLQAMAHRIKGAARIICATPLVEACEALERACTPVAATGQVRACQQHLDAVMQTLEKQLQEQLRKS
ncbi:transporter substrate-binding domain-containing protein [Pseudomonas sp. 21LCFQ02]|uniref:transporter substrate-binding domain-containing protein n=1 Tax=Pseudomonas sp. 21LCFQ02 TaxID=2957505 RepID=UPI00209ABDE8|nr:transporter substrate-binding domain-containing protein [Pseudomonas sp. 21LCFQ02]MCO8167986.1 transporter substrate-binding domain-containing protein [Pseudomonas sp. 21LCFQ02]